MWIFFDLIGSARNKPNAIAQQPGAGLGVILVKAIMGTVCCSDLFSSIFAISGVCDQDSHQTWDLDTPHIRGTVPNHNTCTLDPPVYPRILVYRLRSNSSRCSHRVQMSLEVQAGSDACRSGCVQPIQAGREQLDRLSGAFRRIRINCVRPRIATASRRFLGSNSSST